MAEEEPMNDNDQVTLDMRHVRDAVARAAVGLVVGTMVGHVLAFEYLGATVVGGLASAATGEQPASVPYWGLAVRMYLPPLVGAGLALVLATTVSLASTDPPEPASPGPDGRS